MELEHYIGLSVIVIFLLSGRTSLLALRAYGDMSTGLSVPECLISIASLPFEIYALYWCITNIKWYIPLTLFMFMVFACRIVDKKWVYFMKLRTASNLVLIGVGTYLLML